MRPRTPRATFLLLVLFAIVNATGVMAADFTVDTSNDTVDATPGDGVCADATVHCSLRAAVMEANALGGANTVTLPAGTYVLTIPPSPPGMFESTDPDVGDLDVYTDLTVTGADRDTTIIDGNHQARLFKLTDLRDPNTGVLISSGSLVLGKVTLQNGLGTVTSTFFTFGSDGGAIRALPLTATGGTQLALADVVIKDCESPSVGGGIVTDVATTLTDVVIMNNKVVSTGTQQPQGGGIVFGIAAAPSVLTRVTITGNLAQNTTSMTDALGGGLNNASSDLHIIDSEISNNTALSPRNGEAAGISNVRSITLDNVVVAGNEAINGVQSAAFAGGIENAGGTVVMNGGSLSGNCAGRDHAACANRSFSNPDIGEGGALINSTCATESCSQTGPGTVVMNDVLVQQNFAESNGGAISNRNGGTVTLNGVRVLDNLSEDGGAIYSVDPASQVSLVGSTVDGNEAIELGGGIYNAGKLAIGYSTISNNSVLLGNGGGIESCNGTSLTISNSTVSHNAASDGNAGGLCLSGPTADLSFVTIAANSAATLGGGIYIANFGTQTPKRLKGVILADNTAATGPDCSAAVPVTSLGDNLIEDATGCQITATTGDQFGTTASPIDPQLGTLQMNGGNTETQALGAASVAINAIPPASCTDTAGATVPNDQRGFTRPAGVGCDIGAFERDAVQPPATATPTPTATPPRTPTVTPTPNGGASTTPTATPLPGSVDGYLCYADRLTKGSAKFVPVPSVHVIDALEDVRIQLKKPRAICAPIAPANDAAIDLEQYATKPVKGQPKFAKQTNLRVENQLGTALLDVTKAESLMVPTATSSVSPPPAPDLGQHLVDDYQCYKAKISKGAPKLARTLEMTVGDALTNGPSRYLVKKPRVLCAPANVDGGGTHHTQYQLCYVVKLAKARCGDVAPLNAGASCKSEGDCGGTKRVTTYCQKQTKPAAVSGIFTANQFDAERVDARKVTDLCLPSERIAAQ